MKKTRAITELTAVGGRSGLAIIISCQDNVDISTPSCFVGFVFITISEIDLHCT